MPTQTIKGFLVMCTSCNGLAKEPAYTPEEARKIADIHLLMPEGHKSHAGHIVVIISAELAVKA